MEKLRHYAPGNLLDAAREAAGETAAATTAGPERTGPLTEAYWIKAALAAHGAGAVPGDAAAVGNRHATDQDGEVAWLVRVAAAYRTVTAEQARQVLESTGSAESTGAPEPSGAAAAAKEQTA